MMYVVEMKINGQWVFIGQSNDKTNAEIALKGASMNGECRIREIDETATKEVEAETEETAEHNANDFTLKVEELRKEHITIEEYFNNAYKTCVAYYNDGIVEPEDISSYIETWVDDDLEELIPCLNYEEIEFDTPEWSEYEKIYNRFRENYIARCKQALNVK